MFGGSTFLISLFIYFLGGLGGGGGRKMNIFGGIKNEDILNV